MSTATASRQPHLRPHRVHRPQRFAAQPAGAAPQPAVGPQRRGAGPVRGDPGAGGPGRWPVPRDPGQPLAGLPDAGLPALVEGRLLPGRRRLRLPRPAAGRDGFCAHRPELLREQILLNAGAPVPEGDVQHWWHPPGGAGVRTHFSDDLLWLPYGLCALRRGDGRPALLDEVVAFIEGPAIPEGAEDAYYAPGQRRRPAVRACARAIDRSLRPARTACR
jgi:hypothetical protein